MTHVAVELICKAEDKLVARIETPEGLLGASGIARGIVRTDPARAPEAISIRDGVQLTCRRCHEALFFRVQGGETFAAMPGSVKVEA